MHPNDLLMTAIKATVVYFFLLFIVRMLGKREVGGFTAFDFIVALILGEVVDEIIFSDVSMVKGLLAISVVAAWHLINSWASYRSKIIDRIAGADPTVLVEHGEIKRDAMAKERMSEEELWSELRLQSVDELKEVKRATMEPNGQVSVIQEDWARPVQKGDLPEKQGQAV